MKRRLVRFGLPLAGLLLAAVALPYCDALRMCRGVRALMKAASRQDVAEMRLYFADRVQVNEQWHDVTPELLLRHLAPEPRKPEEIDRYRLIPLIDPRDPLTRYGVIHDPDFGLGRSQVRFRRRWFRWRLDAMQGWG